MSKKIGYVGGGFKPYTKISTYSLYALVCPREKLVRYIGITKQSVIKRLSEHKYKTGKNLYKDNWIARLKRDNLRPVLFVIRNQMMEAEAKTLEKEHIALFRTIVGKKLTNISDGGETKHNSEETRNKISASLKARFLKFPMRKGWHHSEESKRKSRESNLGWKHSDLAKEKMRIAKLGTKRGVCPIQTRDKISQSSKDKMNHGSFLNQKPVQQLDMSGKLIESFSSISAAAKQTGANVYGISLVCNGLNHHARGYKWKWV